MACFSDANTIKKLNRFFIYIIHKINNLFNYESISKHIDIINITNIFNKKILNDNLELDKENKLELNTFLDTIIASNFTHVLDIVKSINNKDLLKEKNIFINEELVNLKIFNKLHINNNINLPNLFQNNYFNLSNVFKFNYGSTTYKILLNTNPNNNSFNNITKKKFKFNNANFIKNYGKYFYYNICFKSKIKKNDNNINIINNNEIKNDTTNSKDIDLFIKDIISNTNRLADTLDFSNIYINYFTMKNHLYSYIHSNTINDDKSNINLKDVLNDMITKKLNEIFLLCFNEIILNIKFILIYKNLFTNHKNYNKNYPLYIITNDKSLNNNKNKFNNTISLINKNYKNNNNKLNTTSNNLTPTNNNKIKKKKLLLLKMTPGLKGKKQSTTSDPPHLNQIQLKDIEKLIQHHIPKNNIENHFMKINIEKKKYLI